MGRKDDGMMKLPTDRDKTISFNCSNIQTKVHTFTWTVKGSPFNASTGQVSPDKQVSYTLNKSIQSNVTFGIEQKNLNYSSTDISGI